MAKRVPADEVPYRPLDKVLVQSVLAGPPPPSESYGGRGGAVAVAPLPSVPESPGPRTSPRIERASPIFLRAAELPSGTDQKARPQSASDLGLERRDREKRVLLSRTEDRDVERLVDRLAGELGTPAKLSHFLRGCITMMLHAEEELVERARKTAVTRPGNGNAPELAEFEHVIAQLLASAFREARPLR